MKLREVTCSRCHGIGHNKATCKEPIEGQLLQLRAAIDSKEEDVTPLLMLTSTTDPTGRGTAVGPTEQNTVVKGEGPLESLPEQETAALEGEEGLIASSPNDAMEQETTGLRRGGEDLADVAVGPTEETSSLQGEEGQPSPSVNDLVEGQNENPALKGEEYFDQVHEFPSSTAVPTEQGTVLTGEEEGLETESMELETATFEEAGSSDNPAEQGTVVPKGEDVADGGQFVP